MKFHAQNVRKKTVSNPFGNWKTWLTTLYKSINNINIIFSDYLQKRYLQFVHLG